MADVKVTNVLGEEGLAIGAIGNYFKYREEYEKETSDASVAMTLAFLAQMVIYGVLAWNAIEDRDDAIDKYLEFAQYLRDQRDIDYDRINQLPSTIGMSEPSSDPCGLASKYLSQSLQDGNSFKVMEDDLAECSCAGIPEGWGTHMNTLAGAMAQASAGELMVTGRKRIRDWYLPKKADIIRKAHINYRSLITGGSVLYYYERAMTIYSGIADLFISGFNSAGAGLGVSLQRLAAPETATKTVIAGSGNVSQGFPVVGIGQTVKVGP